MASTVHSADGVPIRFQVNGKGEPTLVLVHGWALDRRLWDGQVQRLSARHRVVTLDLAGHGESGRERVQWTIAAFGRAVRERPALREINAPIRAVNADKFPTNLEANRRHMPGYEAIILTGTGHYPMLEDPPRFNPALDAALGRVLAAKG